MAKKGESISKIVPVINWCIDNISTPIYSDVNGLNSQFNLVQKNYREDKIWLWFLTTRFEDEKLKSDDTTFRFWLFYRDNEQFLPPKLQGAISTLYKSDLSYNKMSQNTKNKIAEFNRWIDRCRKAVEEDITLRHLSSGQKRYEFILERRFRKTWGINKEMEVKTTNTDNDTNNTNEITITIKEI